MKMKPSLAYANYTHLPARHWEWLEETLATSTADWLIVAGHFPVSVLAFRHTFP